MLDKNKEQLLNQFTEYKVKGQIFHFYPAVVGIKF